MDRVTLTTRDGHTFVYEAEDMQQAATDALLHAYRLSAHNRLVRHSQHEQPTPKQGADIIQGKETDQC